MNNQKLTVIALSFLLSASAFADYSFKVPLEIAQGGGLPNQSIKFLTNYNNEGIKDDNLDDYTKEEIEACGKASIGLNKIADTLYPYFTFSKGLLTKNNQLGINDGIKKCVFDLYIDRSLIPNCDESSMNTKSSAAWNAYKSQVSWPFHSTGFFIYSFNSCNFSSQFDVATDNFRTKATIYLRSIGYAYKISYYTNGEDTAVFSLDRPFSLTQENKDFINEIMNTEKQSFNFTIEY